MGAAERRKRDAKLTELENLKNQKTKMELDLKEKKAHLKKKISDSRRADLSNNIIDNAHVIFTTLNSCSNTAMEAALVKLVA